MKDTLPTFNPGDTVDYCGMQAQVIKDYGDIVYVECEGVKQKWYKIFEDEPVMLVHSTTKKMNRGE